MELKCSHCQRVYVVPEILVPDEVRLGKGPYVCDPCYGPDWKGTCSRCGASPTVPVTGMCGPCTWDDPSTAGGNW